MNESAPVPLLPLESPVQGMKDPAIHLHLHKRWLAFFVVVFIAGSLGAVAWKLHWYEKVHDHYTAGSVTLKVLQGEVAIAGAQVKLAGVTYTTDAAGKITLQNLPAGGYSLAVTKDGYQDATGNVNLHRGDNGLQFLSMVKLPDKVYAVKGFVVDYVSGQAVVNAQVTYAGKTVMTDPSGAYAFTNLTPGSGSLVVSKSGYVDKQQETTVTTQDVVTAQLPLVPTGQLIFVSNRDGHRALYASAYDGTNQRHFTQPQNNGEDFLPVLSPDGKWVAFSSTRANLKDAYGNPLAKLYIVGQDGQNLKLVSEDVALHFAPLWSPNSQRLYYTAYSSVKLDQSTHRVYDVAKGAVIDMGEDTGGVIFAPDGATVAYYVVGTVAPPSPSPTATPAAPVAAAPSPTAAVTPTPIPTATPSPSPSATPMLTAVNILKTFNTATGERKTVVTKQEYVSNLQFSNDGKALGYDVLVAGARKRFQTLLTSGQEAEVAISTADRQYMTTPDGTLKAFIELRDGKSDVYVQDIRNSSEKRLTTMGVVNSSWGLQWDASGRYVVFADKREAENALYIVALSGGDPKKIADYYVEP